MLLDMLRLEIEEPLDLGSVWEALAAKKGVKGLADELGISGRSHHRPSADSALLRPGRKVISSQNTVSRK
jgi:hypothetical protein